MTNTETNEILPDGVDLYDFEDYDSLRKRIFDTTKDTVISKFPISYGGYRLEVDEVDYDDPDHYSIREQKNALMTDKFLGRRLRGKIKLFNETDDSLVEEKRVTLMNVPYMTQRGTFIHNGNEYTVINQFRLEPGIYARKKKSGEYEAHVNPARGTGTSYRIKFEPQSALYRFETGQSSIRLYPVLKLLGIEDDTLRKAWGNEIFEINKKDDKDTLDKLYKRFAKRKYDKTPASTEEKLKTVREMFEKMEFSKDVIAKTFPTTIGR